MLLLNYGSINEYKNTSKRKRSMFWRNSMSDSSLNGHFKRKWFKLGILNNCFSRNFEIITFRLFKLSRLPTKRGYKYDKRIETKVFRLNSLWKVSVSIPWRAHPLSSYQTVFESHSVLKMHIYVMNSFSL